MSRECSLGGRKILLGSRAYFSNGRISACAYPFFCQIVLFIAHTTQNSHSANIQNYSSCIYCIYFVSHPHKPLSLDPLRISTALFHFKYLNSRECKLGHSLITN